MGAILVFLLAPLKLVERKKTTFKTWMAKIGTRVGFLPLA